MSTGYISRVANIHANRAQTYFWLYCTKREERRRSESILSVEKFSSAHKDAMSREERSCAVVSRRMRARTGSGRPERINSRNARICKYSVS